MSDTCRFGHVFKVYDHGDDGAPNGDVRGKIKDGDIQSLEELKHEIGDDDMKKIMGDHYKSLKVSASSAGTPYTVSWACADKFDEDLGYKVEKVTEDLFVTPQSNLHDEFIQRKQQAEQRLNQTLGNLQERKQQKHLLEHDIRKLRSRVEALNSRDETMIKADFVELVDGAGAGGQQGGDEAALKFYRDNNIYPSIVADFYEMDGLDDLKLAERNDDVEEDGKLAHLPANEKAILRKKWAMYDKWKDLYGSEIQRKLQELKGQLKNVERSIKEVQDWIKPYVRDVSMINQTDQDALTDDMNFQVSLRGSATMKREMEFICYRPMENTGQKLDVIDDPEEATHYRVIVIFSVHVNIAGGEQPNSPAGGPSAAKIFYYPAIVCKHVFERIFEEKIEHQKDHVDNMIEDYTGSLESEAAEEMKMAREEKDLSIRELREVIGEEAGKEPPLEMSSILRRIEDGVDQPDKIGQEFGEEYLEALEAVLETDFVSSDEEDEMHSDTKAALLNMAGITDQYVIPKHSDPLGDLTTSIKFDYYYGFKLGLGLHTMK